MQTALFDHRLKQWNDPIHLWCLGDLHFGHINHDYDKLKYVKKEIMKDPYAIVIITGDNVDGRMPDHKYFDLEQVDPQIKMNKFMANCYEAFEDFVSDLAPKVVGIHIGNHELKVNRVFAYVENICSTVNCEYLGYRALSILSTKNSPSGKSQMAYRIFSTHGSGGGRKSGSKVNRIEDEALSSQCDIYIQGHTHFLSCINGVTHTPQLSEGRVFIRERPQIFVNTGSFLKSYKEGTYNYAEKNSYKPQPTGCVMLEILPVPDKIRGHIIT